MPFRKVQVREANKPRGDRRHRYGLETSTLTDTVYRFLSPLRSQITMGRWSYTRGFPVSKPDVISSYVVARPVVNHPSEC